MQITTWDSRPASRMLYSIAFGVSIFLCFYMLGHFATFADGYLHTCKQYRQELISQLFLSGTAIEVVQTRLGCSAIFDFMDYLQPVSGDVIRDNFINTAAALLIGLLCSFVAFLALLGASITSFLLTRLK